MGQEDFESSPSELKIEMEEVSSDIEDIDQLATRPPQKVKPYQENFIEEKLSKARIAESQESTRGRKRDRALLAFMPQQFFCVL